MLKGIFAKSFKVYVRTNGILITFLALILNSNARASCNTKTIVLFYFLVSTCDDADFLPGSLIQCFIISCSHPVHDHYTGFMF